MTEVKDTFCVLTVNSEFRQRCEKAADMWARTHEAKTVMQMIKLEKEYSSLISEIASNYRLDEAIVKKEASDIFTHKYQDNEKWCKKRRL